MNKNSVIPAVIASAVVGALVLTGCAQEPSDGFKKSCKQAGGTIERENDNTLGMGSVSFSVSKPKPVQKAPKVEAPKSPKLPKNSSPKPNNTQPKAVVQTPSGNELAFGKGKKRKSSDDNDFLCVKDGVLLFEEDE